MSEMSEKGMDGMSESEESDCAMRDGLEEFGRKLEETIGKFGHSVIATSARIGGRELSVSYTVGLGRKGLPEVIVFSLPAETARDLLNEAAERLAEGKLELGKAKDLALGLDLAFREASLEAGMGVAGVWRLERERIGRAWQMVWPDPAGKFPWEAGFQEKFRPMQPHLDA